MWLLAGFMVAKLSADCTQIEGKPTTIASVQHEGPAVFQSGGKLFVWTSATTGFRSNPAHLLVSTSGAFEGPFVEAGNPTHDQTSFSSQSTYILRNPAFKPGKRMAEFIYLADRWQVNTTDFGRYVWLPLVVHQDPKSGLNNTVSVTFHESWKYEEPVPIH